MMVAVLLSVSLAMPAWAGDLRGKVSGVADPQDVVVYVEHVSGNFSITTTPVMDQRDMAFAPHVLPVLNGSKVNFPNSDIVRHSVYSTSKERPFNLGKFGMAVTRDVVFKVESPPVAIHLQCAIHSQMSGFVYVLDNPYFTLVEADGTYEITGVPAGTYTVSTWHEKAGVTSTRVTVGATPTKVRFVIKAK